MEQENVVRVSVKLDNSDLPRGLKQTEDQIRASNKRIRDEQGRYIAQSKSAINDFGNHVIRTGQSTKGAFSGLDIDVRSAARSAASHLTNYIGPAAMLALGVAAGKAFYDGVQQSIAKAGKLQSSVQNSLSIKPQLDTRQFYKDLSELQTRVPKTAQELAEASYDIFSSVEVTQKEALSLVEKFSKGATAAVTDTKTWGTAVMGVMNAYKLTVEDVDHIQDVFFNTIKSGVVNGQELASSLGVVTQAAKNAGVGLDEMGALIAAVTKEGGNASQNINNLANTLQKLPTKETTKALHAMGVEVLDQNKNFRPILDVLKDLDEKLRSMSQGDRSKWLQAIFPDAQARTGLQTILSQLSFVEEQLKVNQTEAGAAGTAYQTMAQTYEVAAKLQENSMNRLQEAIGELIITHPAYIEAMKITTEQINGVTDATINGSSETERFGDTLIRTWAKVKSNIIPLLGFMSSVISGFLHGLHALVSGIVGVIAIAIESVVNLVLAGVKEAVNGVIGAINLVQSISTKVFPDSLMGRMGQIEPFEHKFHRVLRSDIPLEGTGIAFNKMVEEFKTAYKFSQEGREARERIDRVSDAYNSPEARAERARMAEERKRLDEERIARARQLQAEAEARKNQRGNGTSGVDAPDPSGRSGRTRTEHVTDDENKFRLSEFKAISEAFKQLTGRDLPTSAYGQSKYHNKIGLDHTNAVDVPLNPNSELGKVLTQLLNQMGVPFRSFDKRHVRADGVVTATGPHFHIGEPSRAFGKNVKSLAVERGQDNITFIKDAQGNVIPIDMTRVQNMVADMRERMANQPLTTTTGPLATSVTHVNTLDEDFRKQREDSQKQAFTDTIMRERNLAHEVNDVWRDVYAERKNLHMDTVVDIERTEQRLAAKVQENADAEVVAARRTLMVRQEQEELYDRLTAAQDRMATATENAALRMQVAYVETFEEIQNRSVEAYERMGRAQAHLEDQTVFHSEQMRAAVLEHAASAKSVTEIWSDAYTSAMDAVGDGISRVVGMLTSKMGEFGRIINDVVSNLMRMVTNRLMVRLLDYLMGNKSGGSGGGGVTVGGGSGGGSILSAGGNIIQGLFNRGGAGTALTGGFAGGNPAQAILSGQMPNGIASVFGPQYAGVGQQGAGAFGRSITDQAAQRVFSEQVLAGAIQQSGAASGTASAGAAGAAGAAGGMTASIAATLPFLGFSLGGMLGGPSTVGSIMGGVGGAVLGAAGGVALLGGAGASIFATGGALSSLGGAAALLTNPFTIAAGAALLIGAFIIGRNRRRREEERVRDQAIRQANGAVDDIIKQLRAGDITTDQALAAANQIRQQYLDNMSQLKDNKTRNHALATVREIDYRINLIKQIGPDVESKKAAAERLRPEFETGGVVQGALGSRQHIVAHAGEIIINRSQQTPQVMAALYAAGVPDVRGAVAMGAQQSGGGGGAISGAVNVTIVLGKQDQTEILINGLKSDKGKSELGRVMRNLKKDGE